MEIIGLMGVFAAVVIIIFAVVFITVTYLSSIQIVFALVVLLILAAVKYGPRLVQAVERYQLAREKRRLVKYKEDLKRAISKAEQECAYRVAPPSHFYDLKERLNETNARLAKLEPVVPSEVYRIPY